MSSEKSSSSRGLLTVAIAVTIVFVTLKLIPVEPVVHWSWWWVLSPIPIYYAFSFLILGIVFFLGAIVALIRSL